MDHHCQRFEPFRQYNMRRCPEPDPRLLDGIHRPRRYRTLRQKTAETDPKKLLVKSVNGKTYETI